MTALKNAVQADVRGIQTLDLNRIENPTHKSIARKLKGLPEAELSSFLSTGELPAVGFSNAELECLRGGKGGDQLFIWGVLQIKVGDGRFRIAVGDAACNFDA